MSFVLENDQGTITVPSATLAALAAAAAERVDGARVRRGRRHLEVEVSDGHAHARLEMVARSTVP